MCSRAFFALSVSPTARPGERRTAPAAAPPAQAEAAAASSPAPGAGSEQGEDVERSRAAGTAAAS